MSKTRIAIILLLLALIVAFIPDDDGGQVEPAGTPTTAPVIRQEAYPGPEPTSAPAAYPAPEKTKPERKQPTATPFIVPTDYITPTPP